MTLEDARAKKRGLAHKVARGTIWVAASYVFSNALNFLKTIILTRLLNPIDFGLMGIALVVINCLSVGSEIGIGMALVQKKEVGEPALNTAWIMNAVRCIVLFAALYFFAPSIALFYSNVSLSPILKFVSLSFLFSAFTSAGILLFVKELNFKNKVIYEQAFAISNTVVCVALAIIFKNVWALVIGYVVGIFVSFLFSYRLHPFRPTLKFDLNAAKGLFHFGKYVFGSSVLVFLVYQGPNALVGKALGLNPLGFFILAFAIANQPATSVTYLVSQIVFPAYAALQDDLPKLREGYLKVARLVASLSAPIAGGIFMLIPEFIQIFLGARWAPIILPVRILCILGFFRSIALTVSPVFYGAGRPDLEFKLASFYFALLAILIYPLTAGIGIVGTSIAFAAASIIVTFFIMKVIYRLMRLDLERPQFIKALSFPLMGTLLMCASIALLKLVLPYSLTLTFLSSILVGGICYVLALYALDRYFGYGLVDTIRFAVNSFKGG